MGEQPVSSEQIFNRVYKGQTKTGDNVDGLVTLGYTWNGTAWERQASGGAGGAITNDGTFAKETGGNLATIAAKDFATQTTLALIKAKTDNIDVALSTRTKPADTQTISGTVTVSNPTANPETGLAKQATQTDGTQKTQVTNFPATQPVSLATAPTTPVTGTFWQTTQPVSAVTLPLPSGAATDATLTNGSQIVGIDNTKSVKYYAQVLTASTTLTPTAGKAIKLVKMQVLQNPDNSSANQVTLGFVSTGNFFTGWVGSDSSEVIGATNEVLSITLANSQAVSVLLRFKEL